MRQENGEVEGNQTFDEELELNGKVIGNVTVTKDGIFHLNGSITKDLILRDGSKAIIHGTVGGSIYNRGGKLLIYGTVKGDLHKKSGATYVDKSAKILGKIEC